MASAAQTAFAPGTGVTSAPASAAQRQRPFCQAAKHGFQPALSTTITPTTTQQNYGPLPLPACGGFLRRLLIEIVGSGGLGSGVGTADYPWNLINEVRFLEPNNTPILDLSGYNLLLADTYGGFSGTDDPRTDPDYSASGNNPVIEPYIPIELDTTAVGALADLSSSSAFQLYLAINPSATIWGTAPSTIPALAISTYQDYWTLPNGVDMDGNPQATAPPYPGTIQIWSQIPAISIATNQRIQLNRMGNQLRTVIIVARASAVRADGAMPSPLLLRWDDIILQNVDLQTLRKQMREVTEGLVARDTGVYVLPYNFGVSRMVGGNGVSSYLPTVTATRYEVSGTITSSTSTIDWVVNEVTSAPVSGVQRTTAGGGLGYYPPAPPPAAATQ
jgi:hypothetical protein